MLLPAPGVSGVERLATRHSTFVIFISGVEGLSVGWAAGNLEIWGSWV